MSNLAFQSDEHTGYFTLSFRQPGSGKIGWDLPVCVCNLQEIGGRFSLLRHWLRMNEIQFNSLNEVRYFCVSS